MRHEKKEYIMKRVSFIVLLSTVCVVLSAQTGEEMLRRAICTNPTNNWGNAIQKGQWTNGSNMSACIYPAGDMYLGNFWGNKKHGYGINIVPDGYQINNCPGAKYYVGYWSNDEKSGNGTCYNASGTLIYNGEFRNDRPTGIYPTMDNYASYKFQTLNTIGADKYIGQTYNGERHGYGIYAWLSGDIWIGNWKDGARAGQGIDIASNGSVTTGNWDNNTHSSTSIETPAILQEQSSNMDAAKTHLDRGEAFLERGEGDSAIREFTEAIRLNPNNAEAYYYRGFVYGMNNDYERAIADFTQAIRLNPNNAEAYNYRGFSYGMKDDYKSAIADFTQAIRLNSNYAEAYYYRGLAYNMIGDIARANADEAKARELTGN
jgi:regulator of sirC expression with transglutaminase-like and TPR domain